MGWVIPNIFFLAFQRHSAKIFVILHSNSRALFGNRDYNAERDLKKKSFPNMSNGCELEEN